MRWRGAYARTPRQASSSSRTTPLTSSATSTDRPIEKHA
jgi:hypothetical protein